MLISTGGSALLSHQIIIDGLRKFSELKEMIKDKNNNKINYIKKKKKIFFNFAP